MTYSRCKTFVPPHLKSNKIISLYNKDAKHHGGTLNNEVKLYLSAIVCNTTVVYLIIFNLM